MKKNRYSPEQIIYALKQVEGGEKAVDICRKMGVSEATFYNWKKKFGRMGGKRGVRTPAAQRGKHEAQATRGRSEPG